MKSTTENKTGKNVLLGISGGIAAYKSCELVRILTKRDLNVRVIMTKHAAEFITPLTFETLTSNPVLKGMFDQSSHSTEHIKLAKWADVMCVAPATANTIAKFARGIADDLLSTTWLAFSGKKIVAPAMNTAMLNAKETLSNINHLKSAGVHVVPPQEGELACGDSGAGKMADIEDIFNAITEALAYRTSMNGLNILITAGPTREYFDDFRFISNPSSGKMGIELVKEALCRGADVTLVHGPISVTLPHKSKNIEVTSALEMLKVCEYHFDKCDVFISCAAVSDVRPAVRTKGKTPKNHLPKAIELTQNPDILKTLSDRKKNHQLTIGFAAETEQDLERALIKMKQKNSDMVVLSHIGRENSAFGADNAWAALITKGKEPKILGRAGKNKIAFEICETICSLLKERKG